MSMQVRNDRDTALYLTCLIIAIISPVFHWAGIWLRGVSFFYLDYGKLVAVYVLLSLSAGSAIWMILKSPDIWVRILAVIGLVLNITSVGYAGRIWREDSHILTTSTIWTPFDAGKIGIIIAPSDDGATAVAEARIIQETIQSLVKNTELDATVELRQVPPITTVKDARYIAQRMQSRIVIWGRAEGSEFVHTEHYITMLGAGAADSLNNRNLMLLLTSISTFNTADNRLASENAVPPTAREVLAPLSLGFASLVANNPQLAAAFFQTALRSKSLDAQAAQTIRAHYALALLMAERPDLAAVAIAEAQAPAPTAFTKLAEGSIALYQGNLSAANKAFLHARSLDPHLAQVYCGLGIIASEQANLDRAEALYNQACLLEPDYGLIYLLQAHLYELRGNSAAAEAAYVQAETALYPFTQIKDAIARQRQELAASPPTPVPTATIAPTPSPMPIPGQRYHTVAKNETLRQIASLYGVSEDDIIKLNHLENRNVLYIGQVLVIPEE